MSFGARARIRLDALTANFDRLHDTVPGARVIAAVKANAYGHGLLTVARALEKADSLAVARLCEAEYLRTAGVETGMLLMGGVIDAEELAVAIDLDCDLVVHNALQVSLLEQSRVRPARVWLKIDTGMHRLGVAPEDASSLIERLGRTADDVGLMTHLANADDRSDTMSLTQLERFRKLSTGFDGDVSIANSAALLGWSDEIALAALGQSGDVWIRPGISLYGISPLVDVSAAELDLQPVMQFETTLIDVKDIGEGERVGYGGIFEAQRDTRIGIAGAGYGDGYSRFLPSGTPVLVNGRRVPLAGVVSMDLIAVDLGPDSEDAIGDRVVLWGEGLPVEEVARCANTTAYPLVTGVIDREGRLI